ncbi:MAG: YIP1 family protein [Methanoregulaceae archaeon]|jgi:hypothetical protein|nr:YIP1 family protein [Methanoregulaceae archaeon]
MEATTRDLLLRPDSYFKDLMKKGESLKIPLIIILVGGILGAFNAYQVSGLTGQMFSQAMSGMGGIVTIMGALAGFVMFFLLWVIYSGIVFAISMAFKGTGSFKRTLEVMGLGMIPQVLGAAVTLLLSFYYLPLVEVPRVTSLQDPAVVQAAVQQLMNDPAMRQLTLVSTAVGILFLLWSANIWIFGVRHARNLSLRHAILVVAIPVAAYIIYAVVMLIIGVPGTGGL